MSVAACRYALSILEADADLGQGARAIFQSLAIRANKSTHDTYTGEWLCRAGGMNEQNMRRNVRRLAELGYIAVDHRRGKSSVVRFPIAGALAAAPSGAGRHDDAGAYHPAICRCPECAEIAAEA